MKFRVGDQVLVTGGKDKGKKGKVVRVLPKDGTVVVEGANLYVRHVKPMQGRSGDRIRKERPLPLAKVAIINDQGKPDRIGYKIEKDGTKVRMFKKSGKVVPETARKASKA
jgi:large subunit ribosomal protein L24